MNIRIILLIIFATVHADESYRIIVNRPYVKNSQFIYSVELKNTQFTELTIGGNPSRSSEKTDGKFSCLVTVLDSNKAGLWNKLKIKVYKVSFIHKGRDFKFKTMNKDILIKRTDKGLEFSLFTDHKLPEMDQTILNNFFPKKTRADSLFDPSKKVGLGDTWSVDEDKLADFFNSTQNLLKVEAKNSIGKFILKRVIKEKNSSYLDVHGAVSFKDLQSISPRFKGLELKSAEATIVMESLLPVNKKLPVRMSDYSFVMKIEGKKVVDGANAGIVTFVTNKVNILISEYK